MYHWNGGSLDGIYTFDTSEQGLSLFEEYLNENAADPVYLLTDVAEEEFRLDSIPHVMGGDRKALLNRKKAKLFRNIRYSYCEVQGRETEGRRDDRVVFSALTDDEFLRPWLRRLEARKVPVAGIYSVALLSKQLLKSLGYGAGPALIVSLQRNAGLRESFFQNGDFKFSRLVRLPRYGTESYAPVIADEMEKMLRYLRSMRQINHDSLVQVYLLADEKLHAELEPACRDKVGVSYNQITLRDIAGKLGLKADFVDPFSESVFVYLLLKNRSGNIYAGEQETRYFTLRRLRHCLLGSSLFLLLGSFIWSGLAFIEGVTLKQETVSARAKTEFYGERYDMARERLPNIPVEPEDLKTAVQVVEGMADYKASPLPLMRTLSRSMDEFPDIQIDAIKWLASMDPNADPAGNASREASALSANSDYIYYQVARVSGSLAPFDGSYRRAIELVNRLAEDIRTQPGVYDVKILTLPLDVSPEARLQGTGDMVRGEAGFSLKIVQGITDET
ncbi:hypothetical protein J2T55_002456 [Methylohalomonas lacus]|uniref:Uncharacterized protein n=1 Tax=Methylohalomonas lacus TaxID=398773 RepID=A0AAE3L228_9GAMM|nr:hypothetical protein [Methylohalomonas lacus]MCS3904420.1 hypothetical protein [Methylohalomonas lacus]